MFLKIQKLIYELTIIKFKIYKDTYRFASTLTRLFIGLPFINKKVKEEIILEFPSLLGLIKEPSDELLINLFRKDKYSIPINLKINFSKEVQIEMLKEQVYNIDEISLRFNEITDPDIIRMLFDQYKGQIFLLSNNIKGSIPADIWIELIDLIHEEFSTLELYTSYSISKFEKVLALADTDEKRMYFTLKLGSYIK